MKQLSRGERLPLAAHAPDGVVQAGLSARGLALDFACFALDASGKLVDDSYMTFFNQPSSPCGGVRSAAVGADKDGFLFDLGRLPAGVERVVITASIDGGGRMSQLESGYLRLVHGGAEFARVELAGKDFAAEQAVMLGELYRKDVGWRFMAVGQGFNGGLAALVAHFGADVAPAPAGAVAASATAGASAVSLEKRVEQAAPQLVSLVKSAGVSLAKAGLGQHRAKVCLFSTFPGR